MDEIVRLVDRVGSDGIIANALFEDALILGPAVIAFLDHVGLEQCRFDAPPDVLFIDTGAPRAVTGVIGIRQTIFRRCEFRNIGIIGPSEAIQTLRTGMQAVDQQASPPSQIQLESPTVAASSTTVQEQVPQP